jgi:hypothetical protein
MHVVAMIDGAKNFAADRVERHGKMLRIAPRREACVLAQRALGDAALAAYNALSVECGDGRQPNAQEQYDQRPLDAPAAGAMS